MFAECLRFRSCQIQPICHPERSDVLRSEAITESKDAYRASEPAPEERPSLAADGSRGSRPVLPVSRSPRTSSPAGHLVVPPELILWHFFLCALKCLAQGLFRRNFHTPANPRIALQPAKPPQIPRFPTPLHQSQFTLLWTPRTRLKTRHIQSAILN